MTHEHAHLEPVPFDHDLELRFETLEIAAGLMARMVDQGKLDPSGLVVAIVELHDTLLKQVRPTLPAKAELEPLKPAVPVVQSVAHDRIACLECGEKFQSLKRHLRTEHDLDPAGYRAKWGLRPDYPMTAPGYSEKRAELARASGLGWKDADIPGPVTIAKKRRGATAHVGQ